MTRWPVAGDVELVTRAERARVLASVARDVRDLELAEDAVQEALLAAVRTWPRDCVPRRPGAWLTTVARRAAMRMLAARAPLLGDPAELETLQARVEEPPPELPDAQLELLFACCHPALTLRDQVALTLRTVAGLTTEEIAAGFLLEPAALAQRLVRAQRRIRDSGIPFAIPDADRLPERLAGVLAVVYLVYTEAHSSSSQAGAVRVELADEAVRLARLTAALLPSEPEALGLAALVLAHDARRAARIDPEHGAVPLRAQDRRAYDRAQLAEASGLLDRAMGLGQTGPYQVQAAIALLHATAPSEEATDWTQIAALYETLARLEPGPMVDLSRAAAIGHADGPEPGLRALALVEGLDGHPLAHVIRADLLARDGRPEDAAAAYERALALVAGDSAAAEDLRGRLALIAGASPPARAPRG